MTPMTCIHRDSIRDFSWSTWNNLITLNDTDTAETALKALSDNEILSAPVHTDGLYWGFTDMFQLVSFIVQICPSWEAKPGVFSLEYFRKRREFRDTTIRQIALDWSLPGEFPRDIREDASVYQCFERMALSGNHRLAVTNFRGRVVGIVTQSMIIDYLAKNMSWFNQARNLPVFKFRPYISFVATIRDTAKALDAFQLMVDRNVNGIAVVDANNRLIDMISTRDLRGMGPGGERFSFLWRSVRDFKAMVRRNFALAPRVPMVTRDSTFGEVISMMNDRKVHRVFVVDSLTDPKPIDLISQTDILRFLLNNPVPSWRRTSAW